MSEVESIYGYIFITKNDLNGKMYLGKTSYRDGHEDFLGDGILLKKDLEKYSPSNFTKVPVDGAKSPKSLLKLENEFIEKHNILNDDKWYNCRADYQDINPFAPFRNKAVKQWAESIDKRIMGQMEIENKNELNRENDYKYLVVDLSSYEKIKYNFIEDIEEMSRSEFNTSRDKKRVIDDRWIGCTKEYFDKVGLKALIKEYETNTEIYYNRDSISCFDTWGKEVLLFKNITRAAEHFETSRALISNKVNTGKPYKNRYTFERVSKDGRLGSSNA